MDKYQQKAIRMMEWLMLIAAILLVIVGKLTGDTFFLRLATESLIFGGLALSVDLLLGYVVEFMALFTVGTGLLVLACAVINGRYQRRKEAVLLKTLGASLAQLRKIQAVEYLILGFLAASVGCVLAYVGSSLLAHFVFHSASVTTWWIYILSACVVSSLTLITGRLADAGLEHLSPLEMLRNEQN